MQPFPTRDLHGRHLTSSSPPASSPSGSDGPRDVAHRTAYSKFLTPCVPFASLNASPESDKINQELPRSTTLELLEKIRADLAPPHSSLKKLDTEARHTRAGSICRSMLKDASKRDLRDGSCHRNVVTPGVRTLGYSLNSTSEEIKTSASTPILAQAANETQKSRLVEISAQLAGFERTLEQKTMSTVQAETTKIQLFKEAITSIEKKVNNEIRQRIESHRILKNTFDQQVQSLAERLENYFTDRLEKFGHIAKAVENRLATVETTIGSLESDDTTKRLQAEIEKSSQEIGCIKTQMVNTLEDRQRVFLERLAAIEKAVDVRFAEEKTKRSRKLQEIKQETSSFQCEQKTRFQEFQSMTLNEITQLREMIMKEQEAREQADDDIVAALKQYTIALHGALSGQLEEISEGI
eukprot:Gregarina_sp_Poly_1__10142@NODE_693_length_6728_cov_41_128809_g523_i0_p1_GENE_NODE_693_length_6728_cov_41_128809_g523_i0NODE_693_length_6728_cov_41_128809_g523_i0_p1_ORF_typecomplete_len410_score71_63SFassemblin/PF06705_11/8_4e34DUF2730/PF10805_8/0_0072DUF2730/PF10805_8/3_1e03POTRA_TamA_1/PF17243_2/0_78POTRA_TamA_1/PF17243_2/8_4e02DUF4743/PF15916_5/4_2e03DUF4743/PF15916_5/2_4DUF3584/PF12128_8/6_9DUF3631/PF12307_8/3_3e03DUF3631/PF12307_8/2Baculo_PEP_C/PF04513_12/2_6Baculo_PEP_C/PF04513_12/5_6Bacu